MAEILFIVTVIFVAYVVYSVVGDMNKKETAEPASPPAKPAAKAKATEKPAAKSEPKPAAKPAASSGGSNEVRNPATGETAVIPSNYRFTKRWIKEALVEEGLLDKVYKNTELDDAASAKVKDALAKFKDLKKYQA